MGEPSAEKAMAAIADLLSNLSGGRSGGWVYRRTPTVLRSFPIPGQQIDPASLPLLYVLPGRESRLEAAGGNRDRRAYQHDLNVDIHGVVLGDATTLTDTWRWRLREDVLEQLHLHLSLGGLARGIDFDAPGAARLETVDAGEIAPMGWFMQPITVWLLDEYDTAA